MRTRRTPPSPDLTDVSWSWRIWTRRSGPTTSRRGPRVIVVVTAGLSSAERVRTAGDLVRSAGLDLRFRRPTATPTPPTSRQGTAGSRNHRPSSDRDHDVSSQRRARRRLVTACRATDVAAVGGPRARRLLRSPLPALGGPVRQCAGVLRPADGSADPRLRRPAGHPGCAGPGLPARASGQPRGVIRPSLFLVLLSNARAVRAHGQHPQRVHARVDLPRLPPHRLHDGPVAAHAVVGEADFPPAARSHHLLAHRALLSSRRRRNRPGRGVLLRGSPLGRAVADPPDSGGPLRGRPARAAPWCCGSVGGTWSNRPVDASSGGSCPVGAHTRTALLAMTVGLIVAGASMFVGHAPESGVHLLCWSCWLDRGHLLRTSDPRLAVARAVTGGGDPAHRADQGVVGNLRAPAPVAGRGSSGRDCPTSPSTASRSTATGSPSTWTRAGSGWSIDAALLLILIFLAVTHRRGLRRAVALFLVTYCLVASITETGLGDASPYLLELVVAASLLAAPRERSDDEDPRRAQPLPTDGTQRGERGRRPGGPRCPCPRSRRRAVPAAQ